MIADTEERKFRSRGSMVRHAASAGQTLDLVRALGAHTYDRGTREIPPLAGALRSADRGKSRRRRSLTHSAPRGLLLTPGLAHVVLWQRVNGWRRILFETNESAPDSAQVLNWLRTVERRLPPQQRERDCKNKSRQR
jgi:hypothetical protein